MDRRTYLGATGAISTGAMIGVAGCLGGAFGGSEWNRTIGLAAPTSGPLGVLGGPMIEGGRFAVDEVREASGGDLGMEVGDTAANPESAQSVARDMRDQGVIALSNLIVSDVGLALSKFAEEEQIPHVGAFTGNTEITKDGTDYFFRHGGNNEQYAAGTIQFFEEMGVSNIAIISLNDSYGNTIVERAEQYASQVGIAVEHVSIVPPGTTNFQPELAKIENDAIGGIFLPYHGKGQTSLAQQIRQAGLFEDNVLVGDYAWGGVATFKKAAGENAAGIHFYGVDLTGSETEEVADSINERFGGEVGTYRIVGYDTARMTAEAIVDTDETDPTVLRDTLQNVDYRGISGWPVRFNDSGDNDAFRMIINKWEEAGDGIQASAPVFKSDPVPGDDAGSILG